MRAPEARWWLAAAVAGGVLAAGCAPHLVRVAELKPGTRAERYRLALAAREARGAAVDAQVVLWTEAPLGRRLPGTEGRLLLAGPDAFRLRVASLFGTALDLAVRGDSLRAYVPSRRRGLSVDAIRDSLGIARPGGLVFRAASGAWRPPEQAWERATWQDSLLRVAWREGDDTLAIAVGSSGLPAWASFTRAAGSGVRVDYRGWDAASGAPWPARLTLTDHQGGFRIVCKVSRARFPARPDSLRFAVSIPSGSATLTLAELRRALERMGAL